MKNIFLILFLVFIFTAGTQAQTQSPIERSWTILKGGISDAKSEKRASAARALGLLEKDEQAEKLAEGALADTESEVRAAAATSLGQIGLRGCIPRLKEALKDQQSEVVFAAAGRCL